MIGRFGWNPDRPDFRDRPLRLAPVVVLPPAVDLRSRCSPIYDQGDLGSCTAQAIAAAVEFDQLTQGLGAGIPSRLFLYYEERRKEGTIDSDSGASIRDGIKVVVKQGCPPEPLWPYQIDQFAVQPPPEAYTQALEHQALEYATVVQYPYDLKAALASGFPIILGITCYESLRDEAVAQTGDIPFPAAEESVIGGHAILLVGYDEARHRYRMRNSWGTGWGDAGYGTLPYAYVHDTGLAADLWVIRTVEGPV